MGLAESATAGKLKRIWADPSSTAVHASLDGADVILSCLGLKVCSADFYCGREIIRGGERHLLGFAQLKRLISTAGNGKHKQGRVRLIRATQKQ